MPGAIPLIRGFALLPTLHWLAEEGASIERALAEVGLSSSPITDPFRPIPLVHAAALLRNAAREHGPDLPCRVLSRSDSLEIAMLGKVALGARTPAEALRRIVAALPYYCSHEQVSFERKPGQYVVREFFAHRFDPETRHLLLQYAAARRAHDQARRNASLARRSRARRSRRRGPRFPARRNPRGWPVADPGRRPRPQDSHRCLADIFSAARRGRGSRNPIQTRRARRR